MAKKGHYASSPRITKPDPIEIQDDTPVERLNGSRTRNSKPDSEHRKTERHDRTSTENDDELGP